MEKSRFVLGTVQFGMPYGVNGAKQPTRDSAFAILDEAYRGGINTFDTAYSYGTAEEILGEWIASRKLGDSVYVITKMRADARIDSPEEVGKELEASRKRLGLEALDGYLLHSPALIRDGAVMEGLREAKKRGLTRNIGVSIYDEKEALEALGAGIDYIQVPYNALDQRLNKTPFFAEAKQKGVTVFARSPLLQGLLAMEPDKIPQHLSRVRPYIERFQEIARAAKLTPLSAAFRYVCSCPGIDHVVFGVHKVEQLREILPFAIDAEDDAWAREVEHAFGDVSRELVDPRLWRDPDQP